MTTQPVINYVLEVMRMHKQNHRPFSGTAETKHFAHLISHPVQGWMGKNKTFCSPGNQNGRHVGSIILVHFEYRIHISEFKQNFCEFHCYTNSKKC